MAPSTALLLPNPFPSNQAELLKNRIVPKFTNPSPELDNLLGGYNGVIYRTRATADYSSEFCNSLDQHGDAPPLPERYEQERLLFSFFTSGLAALESFHYFMFFAGSALEPTFFPVSSNAHLRAISPKSTTSAYVKAFPSETFTGTLIKLNGLPATAKRGAPSPKNSVLEEWETVRNILAHRAAPGRIQYGSFGGPPSPPPTWKIGNAVLNIEKSLTQTRLAWLLDTLTELIGQADQFAAVYFA